MLSEKDCINMMNSFGREPLPISTADGHIAYIVSNPSHRTRLLYIPEDVKILNEMTIDGISDASINTALYQFATPFKVIGGNGLENMDFFLSSSLISAIDFSDFNMSRVKTAYDVLVDCDYLQSAVFDNVNMQELIDISGLLSRCTHLQSVSFANVNANKIQYMNRFLSNCSELEKADLSGISTQNVTDMSELLYNCPHLRNLKIEHFDTRNVENMINMLNGCVDIGFLNLMHFNIENVKRSEGAFKGCEPSIIYGPYKEEFKEIIETTIEETRRLIDPIDVELISKGMDNNQFANLVHYMTETEPDDLPFSMTERLKTIEEDKKMAHELDRVIRYKLGQILADEKIMNQRPEVVLEYQEFKKNHDETIEILNTACRNPCYLLHKSATEHLLIVPDDVTHFDGVVIQSFADKLDDLRGSLRVIGGDGLVDMSDMLHGCKFDSVDFSGLNTSNVRNMQGLLQGCTNLESVNFTNVDTSNVTNMNKLLACCTNLKSVDVSGFDTSETTTMSQMFFGCVELESLNLYGFNIKKVTDKTLMTEGCCKNGKIYGPYDEETKKLIEIIIPEVKGKSKEEIDNYLNKIFNSSIDSEEQSKELKDAIYYMLEKEENSTAKSVELVNEL